GPLLSGKNQELALAVAPHLPPILADAVRIKQILLNLLGNAHKFSPEGGRIDLRAQRAGDCVCFSVTDQGDGIRPEQHELVFQEFAQLDSSSTRRQEGTGLGLPIARQLVEMHGGRLWVDSDGAPGKGAAFHFTIPVVQSAAGPGAPASDQPAGDETRRALIIEDDRQFGNLLALYLRQQGYQPIQLYNGQASLKAIRELRPALVTLDLMMPDHDGWSVLRDLKRAPDTRDVPLIIVSALDQSDSGLEPGHAEYLTKPLDYEALLAALRRIDPALRPARTRVLIVDDDPLVAQLLETMLPASDYEVTTLTSPLDALERIRRDAPDALILDLLMPEMSGNELLQILRADPLTRDLPVIIVTAKHIGVDEQARLAETAQTVIRKTDLTCDRLIEALRRLRLPAPSEARVMEVIP
ncbi:MAG TPA: response regulator, partial [Anaerolineae bacterium]|nr:response regulator [Anaerolineae bacterium]